MPRIEIVSDDRRDPKSLELLKFERDIYSQYGEDGILQELFKRIGVANKWSVEFGAWDGVHLSNTCYLIRDHDWYGVQIEGDKEKFEVLMENFGHNKKAFPVLAMVGYKKGVNTIDHILSKTPIPKDFDLISIDIDSNDWYIWESIVEYQPRVVVCEYNPTIDANVIFVQERSMNVNQGCSLRALVELGKDKGYELVAVTRTNGIFVKKELFPLVGIKNNGIHDLAQNANNFIFQGYDGTIFNTLYALHWSDYGEIEADALQVLPSNQRHSHHAVSLVNQAEAEELMGGPTTTGLIKGVAAKAGSKVLRNYLVNGSFAVWSSEVSEVDTGLAMGPELWDIYRGGYVGGLQVSQTEGPKKKSFALRIARQQGDSQSASCNVSHDLRSEDSVDLAGDYVTLSFWYRTGEDFKATSRLEAYIWATLENNTPARSGPPNRISRSLSVPPSIEWKRVQLTTRVDGDRTQLHTVLSWTPSAEIGTSGEWLEISCCQLEAGREATDFEVRSLSLETALVTAMKSKPAE